MNVTEAIAQLKVLCERARTAGDEATAADVAAQVRVIACDASLAPCQALAAAVINAASALVALGPAGEVQGLFQQAQRILGASSDASVDDQLMLVHNLGALYQRHRDAQLHEQTLTFILQTAEHYDGPLQAPGADVFTEHAMMHKRQGRTDLMLLLLRQVHRYRTAADRSPADRVSWLQIYASILLDAGQIDEVLAIAAQGADLAHALGQAELEASLLMITARAEVARNDRPAAVAALDRALQVVEHPALARTTHAVLVWLTLASQLLNAGAKVRYPEARQVCEKAIDVLRALGITGTHDFAYALYLRAVLTEHLGDWRGAARGYLAASAVQGAERDDATGWLTLAGRAWFEAGEWDAASDCYLDAVRRRVST
jgi:tetratricopeptide (TPR) repeat protein